VWQKKLTCERQDGACSLMRKFFNLEHSETNPKTWGEFVHQRDCGPFGGATTGKINSSGRSNSERKLREGGDSKKRHNLRTVRFRMIQSQELA